MKKNNIAFYVVVGLIIISVVVFGFVLGPGKSMIRESKFKDYAAPVSGAGTGFYRHCYEELNENEQLFYRVLVAELYTQPDKIQVPQLKDGDLSKVFKAISYDNPDLFNLGLNCKMYKSGNDYFFEPEYALDYKVYKAQLENVQKVADDIISRASIYKTDYEKEKFVHDYIINHCTYMDPQEESNRNTMYGCLVEGKASCEGYSRAFQYIMSKLNIDNRLITGDASDDGVKYIPHMWNFVTIDGKSYYTDITWDDPKGDAAILRHTYFNLNTEEVLRNHKNIEQTVAECTHSEHNYFVKEFLQITTGSGEAFKSAISNGVFAAVQKKQKGVEFRFPNIAVMEQAKNSLFNTGVIYDVFEDAGVIEDADETTVAFMTDDAMNTICIFF